MKSPSKKWFYNKNTKKALYEREENTNKFHQNETPLLEKGNATMIK